MEFGGLYSSLCGISGTKDMSPNLSVLGNHPGPLTKAETQSVQLVMDWAFSQTLA